MKIHSFGADTTVTGSMHLLDCSAGKYLIDAGMFQGDDEVEERNQIKLGFHPNQLTSVFLTHAHYDHCGRLPLLYKLGFRGKIFATKQTRELAEIILRDSVKIMESESSMLYTIEDVESVLTLFNIVEFGQFHNAKGIQFKFGEAGHILGASWLLVKADGKNILFSGDLGRDDDQLIRSPDYPSEELDLVIVESTYGDRTRSNTDVEKTFTDILNDVIKKKRVWMIPSFAMARTQNMITLFYQLIQKHPELELPVWVSSPMAQAITEIYKKNAYMLKDADTFLAAADFTRFAQWPKQNDKLDIIKGPVVIIASSGMINGGRIQRIMKYHGPEENNLLTLVGYQGEGTLGHYIQEGGRKFSLSDKEKFELRCEVKSFDMFSAHADYTEITKWLKHLNTKRVHIVHGEIESQKSLLANLQNMSFEVTAAFDHDQIEI